MATSRYPRRGAPQVRLRIGFVLIAMVLSVFGGRLVQLQGLDPGSYAAMAAAEGSRDVILPATRGDILDRNGEPLAESVDGVMVIADPALVNTDEAGNPVDRAPQLAKLLSTKLDVDYVTVLERLRRTYTRFQYMARAVPAAKAAFKCSHSAEQPEPSQHSDHHRRSRYFGDPPAEQQSERQPVNAKRPNSHNSASGLRRSLSQQPNNHCHERHSSAESPEKQYQREQPQGR